MGTTKAQKKWARVSAGLAIVAAVLGAMGGTGLALRDPYGEALGLRAKQMVGSSTMGSDTRGVGIFTTPLAGFPLEGKSFVILASGVAADAYLPDTNNNESLSAGGLRDDRSTNLGGVPTNEGQDLVQLQLRVEVPNWARGAAFDFSFFTEEWPDYYGSPYNDAFVAQLGEKPLITIGKTKGSVFAPGNVVYDANGRLISANVGFGLNTAVPNPNTGTTYDGTTGVLTTAFPLPEGMTELVITFSIFDVWDSNLDSAVFIDNLRFLTQAPPAPVTQPKGPSEPILLPAFGRITGGGALDDGGFSNFGGNVAANRNGMVRGEWQYVSRDGNANLHSMELGSVQFGTAGSIGPDMPATPYNIAWFSGTAEVNGLPGYSFTVWLEDRGEPGDQDHYRIRVLNPAGGLVLDEEGVLISGNIQIHPPAP